LSSKSSPKPPELVVAFPPKFDELRTAELHVSEVDDYLRISINGEDLPRVTFGNEPGPFRYTDTYGVARIGILIGIDNSQYGGCGARVELWLNGQADSNRRWYWFKEIVP
jgi:hypothetical protein